MTDETTLTISNSCQCEDEAGQPFDCGGDCFASDAELINNEAAAWLERNPSEHGYLIEGAGMGWQKRTGTRDWDGREPLYRAIGVDAAWTQDYTFAEHEIRVRQSHHDAMGERYVVRAKRADEE